MGFEVINQANSFVEVKTMQTAAVFHNTHLGLSPRSRFQPGDAAQRRPSESSNASREQTKGTSGPPVSRPALGGKEEGDPRSMPLGPATDREFKGAVLLIVALYASMALLNAGAAWSALVTQWQSFIDFLASGLLG